MRSMARTSVGIIARQCAPAERPPPAGHDGRMGTIAITGSASGMGAATRARLQADGHTVIGVDLHGADIEADPLEETAQSLRDGGADVFAVTADVSRAADVERIGEAAIDVFGALHVACNNAGVGTGGPTWEIDLSVWEWVLGVNLMGVTGERVARLKPDARIAQLTTSAAQTYEQLHQQLGGELYHDRRQDEVTIGRILDTREPFHEDVAARLRAQWGAAIRAAFPDQPQAVQRILAAQHVREWRLLDSGRVRDVEPRRLIALAEEFLAPPHAPA